MNFTIKTPYYGWWIVAAAIVCQFAFMSFSQAVVGIFMKPALNELGWPVWQFTLGPSLAVGVGALSGVFAGPIVDKSGPRRLILLGAFVSAICFYALGRQSNLLVFLALYMLAGLIGWNLFGPLVVNSTLNKWFIRKRGWALAIGSIGISLAGMLTPITMTAIVDSVGWRDAYTVLAFFTLLLVIPMAFVMRRSPEDHGLFPDGDVGAAIARENTEAMPETPSLTRGQAIRTKGFWLLVFGFGFKQAALSSVFIHAIPFATDVGFSRSIAAIALTITGLGNLLSKAVWGYTLQRIDARKLAVSAFLLSSLGVAFMLVAAPIGQESILFVGFFLYGLGFGGTIPLSEFLWAKYFGRAHIGAIRGISQPITLIAPTVGPVLIGLWYDYSNSYYPGFLTIVAVYLIGALLIWLSRAPSEEISKEV